MTPQQETIHYPFSKGRSIDWVIFFVVLILGAFFTLYVYSQGMTLMMVDQYSHDSIARQLTDSKTPGISQLGFWPPLLHIVMAPFTAIDSLYYSGLAGAFVLIPFLALSTVFFYHLVFLLTRNQPITIAAIGAYALNPYMLYFAATPMTDFFYVGVMVMATYFFVHWWKTESLISLLWMGMLAGLAPMARFEGFALVPMIGLFILVRLWMKRASYYKIESVAVLYGLLAAIGIVFILSYGMIFNDNPLAFLNDEWSAHAQQRDFFLPTEHSIDISFLYLVHTTGVMLGWPLLILLGLCLMAAPLIVRRERLLIIATSFILISPFLFDWLALFQGSAIIQLPHLPPYDIFYFNERYGIYPIAFALLIPSIVAASIYHTLREIKWYFMPAGVLLAGIIMMVAINGSLTHLTKVACYDCFEVIKMSRQISPYQHNDLAEVLQDEYDGGSILMTRALHNAIAVRAGIPLKDFVLESNEHYYDQAIAYPWLFSRWVVMYSDDITAGDWYLAREEVSRNWSGSDQFNYYYEKVFDSDQADLYRLRESRVYEFAQKYTLATSSIPSLDRTVTTWDRENDFDALVTQIDTIRENMDNQTTSLVER